MLGVVAYVMIFENRMIYMPERFPAGDWDAPRRGPLPARDVWLTTSDGVRIHGWSVRGPDARHMLLYFHGNAGNLSHRYDWLCALASLPAEVLLIDYRGYGRSDGRPSEEGLFRDGRAAYRYARETLGWPAGSIVPYGKSLGGAVACQVAAESPCGALILQSTFTSARDMAQVILPFFPTRHLIRHRFDNLAKVARITCPKLIVHSRADEIIPVRMARRLYAAAAEPKQLLLFDAARHNDLVWRQETALLQAFRRHLARIEPRR